MIEDQEKLIDDIHKRLQTMMIGSIARVEESFGYLWNHGNNPDNSNQIQFKKEWDDLRNELLNHGNNQIRQAVSDMYKFFHKNRFKYRYKFLNKGEDRHE